MGSLGTEDPLDEEGDSVVPGLVHRYPDRVLMVLTDICPMLCRHCTRKREWRHGAWTRSEAEIEMMLDYLHGHLKATLDTYRTMGMPQENVAELEQYGKAFIDTVYPSLMIIGVGFAVWLNVIVARPVFRMGNLSYPEFISMDRWQAPEVMIWGVIVSGFALFLLPGVIQSLAANVLLVLMVIYLFHGLSIILFFLNKYRLPSWVRIGVYFLIVVQQLFLLLLAIAGLFDQWVDFRKLRRESET